MIPPSLRLLLDQTRGQRLTAWAGRTLWLARETWGELAVCLQGAQVLHFRPGPLCLQPAASNWLWVTPEPREAPGTIRGGIPLCWPWFADERTADESPERTGPFHGPARTADWQLHPVRAHQGGVLLKLTPALPLHSQLSPRVIIKANASQLEVDLLTTHVGQVPVTLTAALHSYLWVSDVRGCRVEGLAETPYLDKHQDFASCHQHGELVVDGALDRIYNSTAPVVLHNGQHRLRLSKQGSRSTVVWHPGNALPADTPAEAGRQFLCLEAACTRLDPVRLAPGDRHRLRSRLER